MMIARARRFIPWFLAAGALVALPVLTHRAHAQDLKDELDALESPPEDDLGSGSGNAAANPPAKSSDPLDNLPTEGQNAKAPDDGLESDLNADSGTADDGLDKDLAGNENDSGSGLTDEVKALDNPQQSLTGVDLEAQGKMTSIEFKQMADRVRLVVKGDRSIDWARELRSKRRQIIVELKNMKIARDILRRPLDTGEFDGPVALVQAFESKTANIPSVKVLFQLRQFVDPTVLRSGNELYVDFPIVTDGNLFRGRAASTPVIPKTFLSATGPLNFKGNKITLNVKDADLQDVLNLISRASGKDFVLSSATPSKVTMNVRNVPWDQVLSIILLNAKLGYQEIGNTFRIVPITELKTEIDEAAKAEKAKDDLVPLETRIYPLSYARATDISTNIADFKTSRGKSSVDARTNSLVVTDVPETLEKVARYIRSVDKQTSQVLIEARIVEAKQNFQKNIGVQWKVGEVTSGSLADSFVNVGSAGGTVAAATARGGDVASTGANGGARVKLGNLGSLGAIQAVLQLAEREEQVRTLASPRITVLDNRQATISQGTQVPCVTQQPNGAPPATTYIPADLKLDVKPQVTSDGFVLLNMTLGRDTPTGGTATTCPGIDTRKANTEMLVESGKTAVIGGIYTADKTNTESGWPGLRSLPIFGVLFRDAKNVQDNMNELLMFISPRILNADKAFLVRSQNLSKNDKSLIQSGGDEEVPDDTF